MAMIESFKLGAGEFILLPKISPWLSSAENLQDVSNVVTTMGANQGHSIHTGTGIDLHHIAKLFSPSYLEAEKLVSHTASGRGLVYFFQALQEGCVLRHYYRGGLVAKVSTDKFFYQKLENTRPFKELNILAKLHAAGLNVPKPLAARVKRRGLSYSGDIITGEIEQAQELHDCLSQQALAETVWHQIGATLRKMHDMHVCHDDINVKNILLQDIAKLEHRSHQGSLVDNSESKIRVFVLDFDACEVRNGHDWKQANLNRFKRSLDKQKAKISPYYFDEKCWQTVLAAYNA